MCSDLDMYFFLSIAVIPLYFNHLHFQKRIAQLTIAAELNLHRKWVSST